MAHDVSNVMQQIGDVITQTVHAIRVVWNSFFGRLMKSIVVSQLKATWTFVRATLRLIGDVFHTIGDLIHGRWGRLWGDIKQLARDAIATVLDYIRNIPIVNVLTVLATKAFNAAVTVGGKIKDGVVSGLAGIAGAVGGAAAAAVNALIDVINEFHISIHKSIFGHGINIDWSPGLSHVSFAQGGVVTSPTLAWVGESAGSRPEIVTPERLMRQIMREEGGGGGGVYALTITNWHEGSGYIAEHVAGAGRLARQHARMAR